MMRRHASLHYYPSRLTRVPIQDYHVSIPGCATYPPYLHSEFEINMRPGQNRDSLQSPFFEYDLISLSFTSPIKRGQPPQVRSFDL